MILLGTGKSTQILYHTAIWWQKIVCFGLVKAVSCLRLGINPVKYGRLQYDSYTENTIVQ